MTAEPVHRRLNWGCGHGGDPGWINSDINEGPGIDISGDILEGLPLEDASVDYAVSIHALQEVSIDSQVTALAELRRVLKPGGVLRLVLPDLLKGVEAYGRGDRDYFAVPDEDAESLGGKLVVQLVWYGFSRTLYVPDFIEEFLRKADFGEVHHVSFRRTASPFPEIVELDSRERESLFVEAVR